MPFRQSTSRAFRQPSFWKLLLHLPKLIRLTLRLMKDGRVPLLGKATLVLAIGYFLWPVDLIPEAVMPVIGHVDDLGVLLAGLRYLLHQTPPNILEEHLADLKVRSVY